MYLAHDEVLDRPVALQILREQYAEDEEFIQRFRFETRSAASLSQPDIISIYDQGRAEDGEYYIAVKYLAGGALKERLQQERVLQSFTLHLARLTGAHLWTGRKAAGEKACEVNVVKTAPPPPYLE